MGGRFCVPSEANQPPGVTVVFAAVSYIIAALGCTRRRVTPLSCPASTLLRLLSGRHHRTEKHADPSHTWLPGGTLSLVFPGHSQVCTPVTCQWCNHHGQQGSSLLSYKYIVSQNFDIILKAIALFFFASFNIYFVASIVVYYGRVFIQSQFSYLVLSGCMKSAWGLQSLLKLFAIWANQISTLQCRGQLAAS